MAETTPESLLRRPSVTPAVEIYPLERERKVNDVEAELAQVFANRPARPRMQPVHVAWTSTSHGQTTLDAQARLVEAVLQILLDNGSRSACDAIDRMLIGRARLET